MIERYWAKPRYYHCETTGRTATVEEISGGIRVTAVEVRPCPDPDRAFSRPWEFEAALYNLGGFPGVVERTQVCAWED